jgi:hypothetical protein
MSRLRGLIFVIAVSAFALIGAGTGAAHGTGSHTGFQARVSYLQPQVPGLLLQVLEGHVKLSAANLTQKDIVILDAQGGAKIRIPAGKTRVWREPRIGATEAPPDREGLVRNWRIKGTADGEPFQVVGFLGYRPPPDAASSDDGLPPWAFILLALGGAALLAAALAVPMLRRGEGAA